MKLPKILLGLAVWSASIATAYYMGLQVTSESSTVEAPGSDRSVTNQTSIDFTDQSESEAPLEVATSFFDDSKLNLEDAIGEFDRLTEEQTRDLLAQAFALPETDFRRSRFIRELLVQLAETAPEDALAMAAGIESLRESEEARISILEVWAENDPLATLEWARLALVSEPLRAQRSQLVAIYEGYAKNNPQAAFAAALQLPNESSFEQRIKSRALEEILEEQISSGGLLEAKIQVELLEEGPIKSALLNELVDEWASHDPVGAAAYVESLGENATDRMKTNLLSEWAESDPAAAAAWLDNSDFEENTLSQASSAIIREWTRYDMAASAEWLNTQPASPALDRAVISYTYQAAQEDPANAITWAESIENDSMRNRMMQHVAGNWKAEDPEAFQTYLDSSEFDEKQLERLQNAQPIQMGRRRGRP
ncbi:MAG: hypothetical protein AAF065_00890 [Verrucomicrobiota bacterium]